MQHLVATYTFKCGICYDFIQLEVMYLMDDLMNMLLLFVLKLSLKHGHVHNQYQ